MRSRNELVKMLAENGRIKIFAGAISVGTCSLCAMPLYEGADTADDGDGPRHPDLRICIDELHKQQRALEHMIDEQRRIITLLNDAHFRLAQKLARRAKKAAK